MPFFCRVAPRSTSMKSFKTRLLSESFVVLSAASTVMTSWRFPRLLISRKSSLRDVHCSPVPIALCYFTSHNCNRWPRSSLMNVTFLWYECSKNWLLLNVEDKTKERLRIFHVFGHLWSEGSILRPTCFSTDFIVEYFAMWAISNNTAKCLTMAAILRQHMG